MISSNSRCYMCRRSHDVPCRLDKHKGPATEANKLRPCGSARCRVHPKQAEAQLKTTAQCAGFVSIDGRTLDQVNDPMVLRYDNGDSKLEYHGDNQRAVDAARPWEDRFELD